MKRPDAWTVTKADWDAYFQTEEGKVEIEDWKRKG